jgi:hypothetical protein
MMIVKKVLATKIGRLDLQLLIALVLFLRCQIKKPAISATTTTIRAIKKCSTTLILNFPAFQYSLHLEQKT